MRWCEFFVGGGTGVNIRDYYVSPFPPPSSQSSFHTAIVTYRIYLRRMECMHREGTSISDSTATAVAPNLVYFIIRSSPQ